jgi:hypothetical protein
MPVLAGDARSAWDRRVLRDPRVTQLWDRGQLVGRWFAAHGGPFWDAFLFYLHGASCGGKPTSPADWGSTIIGSSSKLSHDLTPWLER